MDDERTDSPNCTGNDWMQNAHEAAVPTAAQDAPRGCVGDESEGLRHVRAPLTHKLQPTPAVTYSNSNTVCFWRCASRPEQVGWAGQATRSALSPGGPSRESAMQARKVLSYVAQREGCMKPSACRASTSTSPVRGLKSHRQTLPHTLRLALTPPRRPLSPSPSRIPSSFSPKRPCIASSRPVSKRTPAAAASCCAALSLVQQHTQCAANATSAHARRTPSTELLCTW